LTEPAGLPLATTTWGEEERRVAHAVIDSGQTTMGAQVKAFERQFAAYFGSKYAVMSNSGSSANLLAVASLFFGPSAPARGSIAVVPAVSWATTYYPLSQYGLRLRFVDVDPDTLNFDLTALATALDDQVSVIFAVNLLGNPNDYAAIQALIGDRPITLLEDNCESMGARLDGRFAGTFGRIGTFSTFFSHHISTMEGGLCITDDERLYQTMVSLRSHGWTRTLPAPNLLIEPHTSGPFYDLFRFILPGYNLRPLEISGAIGIEQLKKLPGFVAQRRENAVRFQDLFSNLPGLRIQREIGESSWFGFAFVLTPEARASRDEIVSSLRAHGFESRPIVAGNFYRNPVIQRIDHEPHPHLPNADEVHDRGFYVGNHHWDVTGQLQQLHRLLSSHLGFADA